MLGHGTLMRNACSQTLICACYVSQVFNYKFSFVCRCLTVSLSSGFLSISLMNMITSYSSFLAEYI
jgi:hypothetical protein